MSKDKMDKEIEHHAHAGEEHIEIYAGDPKIRSGDAPVDAWLKFVYFTLPIWGIITLALYWNGSWGWLDPGYWAQLQKAANTTFPYINVDELPPPSGANTKQSSEEARKMLEQNSVAPPP